MKKEKVTIIIAEFMGYKYYATHSPSPVFVKNNVEYNSVDFVGFDKLVPVWEKFTGVEFEKGEFSHNLELVLKPVFGGYGKYKFECHLYLNSYEDEDDATGNPIETISRGDTPQEAAAIATAKAILELK